MLLIRFLVLILVVVAVAVVAAIVNTWWIAVIAIVVLVAMTVATVLLVLHYTGAPDWLGPDENAQLESGGLVADETGLPTRRRWNDRQARAYAADVARRGLVAVPDGWRGPDGAHRVLLVTTEPVSARQLGVALPDDVGPGDLAVLVVVPTLAATAREFHLADPTEAVEHAEQIARDTVTALRASGVQTSGHIGPADPAVAVSDGLRTYDAEQVIVARHRQAPMRYLEDVPLEDAAGAFDVPLRELTLNRAADGR
jgi:hypothetical protein